MWGNVIEWHKSLRCFLSRKPRNRGFVEYPGFAGKGGETGGGKGGGQRDL